MCPGQESNLWVYGMTLPPTEPPSQGLSSLGENRASMKSRSRVAQEKRPQVRRLRGNQVEGGREENGTKHWEEGSTLQTCTRHALPTAVVPASISVATIPSKCSKLIYLTNYTMVLEWKCKGTSCPHSQQNNHNYCSDEYLSCWALGLLEWTRQANPAISDRTNNHASQHEFFGGQ